MKNSIKIIVATLCIAFIPMASFAQTPPIPTPIIPDHLPIGKMAIAEALAKVVKLEIVTTAPSVVEEFRATITFDVVKSTQDIIDALDGFSGYVEVMDPKDLITTTAVIYDKDGRKLFLGVNAFKQEKVGYDGDGEPIYQNPAGSDFMFFELLADPISFPGVTGAWAVTYNGEIWGLQCNDGKVTVPGWMSLSNVSEIVINGANGTWRYDMNTGLLLMSQDSEVKVSNVFFNGLQEVWADSYGVVTIYTQPRYGYVPLVEFNNQGGRFHLDFSSGQQYDYTKPIAVRIATLDDLKNGRGWTIYNFPQGGLDLNLPLDTYYIYPEYDTKDFGWGFPSTPSEG